jgi:hypothetical protein
MFAWSQLSGWKLSCAEPATSFRSWVAVVMMLVGAVPLVAGIGASALWIAVATVGIALVAIERTRGRHGAHA